MLLIKQDSFSKSTACDKEQLSLSVHPYRLTIIIPVICEQLACLHQIFFRHDEQMIKLYICLMCMARQ